MSTVMSAIGEAIGMKPDDWVIALGAMSTAKMKAIAYSTAAVESASPDLRHLFTTHLNDALAEHERWTKLAVDRGWYKAYASPEELLRQAVNDARAVMGEQPTEGGQG